MKNSMKRCLYAFYAIVIVSMLGATTLPAQTFKVLAAKNVFVKNGAAEQQALRIGAALNPPSTVVLDANGYLALIHSSGKSHEVRISGSYTVAELEKQMLSRQSNVSSNMAKYLTNSMAANTDGDSYRKNMQFTGSVARMSSGGAQQVEVLLPRSTSVLEPIVEFSWNTFRSGGGLVLSNGMGSSMNVATETTKQAGASDETLYEFTIQDASGVAVFAKVLSDTTLRLNVHEIGMNPGVAYSWSVARQNKPRTKSQQYHLTMLSNDAAQAVQDTVSAIQGSVEDKNSALSKILLASYYEQAQLLFSAFQAYREAIASAPDVQDYKDMLAAFLKRTGLSDRAAKALSQKL